MKPFVGGSNGDSLREAQRLTAEVFQLTGQKVDVDDPVVVAALLQSMLLRQAGQTAAAAILEAGKRSPLPQIVVAPRTVIVLILGALLSIALAGFMGAWCVNSMTSARADIGAALLAGWPSLDQNERQAIWNVLGARGQNALRREIRP